MLVNRDIYIIYIAYIVLITNQSCCFIFTSM